MRKITIVALALFSFLACLNVTAQQRPNVYSISFSLSDPPSAQVEAEIAINESGLFMIGGAVNHLPRGWDEFVHELKITDMAGSVREFEEFSDDRYKARWRSKDGFRGRARLSYRVDYSFAKTNWPAGNEQAAFYDGKALYAASRTAIILSDLESQNQIKFIVPTGSKIAAPWKPGADNIFAASGSDLVNNTFVVGDFGGVSLRQGNFEFTLALLGDIRGSEALISSTLTKFARYYATLFPETPSDRFLMTLFYANTQDGEAYNQSAAFTTQPTVGEENLIVWGNTLGHELFHYWNSGKIKGAVYEDSQWLSEGFTEYYANLAFVREGILPEKFLIWKMEGTLAKYLYFRSAPQFSTVSLKDSGQKKTTYRFGVYDGGWAAAFALDMTLREKTGGRKTLDDFMRSMYAKFGKTGIKYQYVDVVTTASEVAGSDLSDFFKRYVEGTEPLPVISLLESLGYATASQDYAAELLIYPVKPTPLRTQWLHSGKK